MTIPATFSSILGSSVLMGSEVENGGNSSVVAERGKEGELRGKKKKKENKKRRKGKKKKEEREKEDSWTVAPGFLGPCW